MTNWSRADIPSQSGKLAVVTGTGGLGYETAVALAAAGAEVILAGRSESKGVPRYGRFFNNRQKRSSILNSWIWLV